MPEAQNTIQQITQSVTKKYDTFLEGACLQVCRNAGFDSIEEVEASKTHNLRIEKKTSQNIAGYSEYFVISVDKVIAEEKFTVQIETPSIQFGHVD